MVGVKTYRTGWLGWRRWWRAVTRQVRYYWTGAQLLWHGNQIQRCGDSARAAAMPILLLHGFGSTRRSLEILEQRLRGDGFDVYSLSLGGLLGTINTRRITALGAEVLDKLAHLRARHPLGKFVVIGHSKGGLLGRYLVSCLNGAEHVHGVITLGTPHQGYPYTQLRMVSRWGLAMASVREMRPTSRLFTRLRQCTVPATVHCVSICSEADRIVPPALCVWDMPGREAAQLITIAGVSHTDYLLKTRVYESIRAVLQTWQHFS